MRSHSVRGEIYDVELAHGTPDGVRSRDASASINMELLMEFVGVPDSIVQSPATTNVGGILRTLNRVTY